MIHFIVTTRDSLKNSKAAGMAKFLIGVQRNAGSYAFVTIGSFKKVFENSDLNCDPQSDDDFSFFPGIDHFGIACNCLRRVDCHGSDQCGHSNLSSCGIADYYYIAALQNFLVSSLIL